MTKTKAKNLEALQVDLEGRLMLDGKTVRAIPCGRPDIVFTKKRTRMEGSLKHGDYGYFEKTVNIPTGANAYVLGSRASMDYAAIQFYIVEE